MVRKHSPEREGRSSVCEGTEIERQACLPGVTRGVDQMRLEEPLEAQERCGLNPERLDCGEPRY